MAKLIMLIGIPGSGKTTHSNELSLDYNAKVISTDKVRQTYVDIDEKLKSISKEAYNDIINLPDFYM